MKILIISALFIMCSLFAAFSQFGHTDNNHHVADPKFQKFFTGYNPDFQNRGIMKSSFRHEVILNK